MLNSILSRYYPVSSFLHQLHPVIKFICLFLFFIISWITDSFLLHLFFLLFLFLLILLSHVPITRYLKPIWGMKFLFIFLFLINIFCGVSWISNFVMLFRLIELLISTTLVTVSTKSFAIIYALETIFSPLKIVHIPVSTLAMMIALALQFIPNIMDQANKILKSLSSRGLDYETASLKERWKILKALVIPMFLLSFKRADQLAESMELRHYQVGEKRTSIQSYPVHKNDLLFLEFHIFVFVLLLMKEVIL